MTEKAEKEAINIAVEAENNLINDVENRTKEATGELKERSSTKIKSYQSLQMLHFIN